MKGLEKTYQPKGSIMKRKVHRIDAEGKVLGRLASNIAVLLIGKHKPNYSAHMDSGDFVEVVNASKFVLTGKKTEQKVYRRHSGYPGGFKEVSFTKMFETRPVKIIYNAVSGMLPDNRLKAKRLSRLSINI